MIRYNLALVIFVVVLFACSKARCPAPVAQTSQKIIVVDSVVVVDSVYIVTLQPDAADGLDVKVTSLAPAENSASYNYLAIETWTVGGATNIVRTLIDFDYSSIPSGVTITKAVLTLYADTTDDESGGVYPPGHQQHGGGGNSAELNRITSPWNKQTVTWQTMPTVDSNTSISVPASTSASETYNIDVSAFVKDQLASPSLYHGFLIKLVTEEIYNGLYFYSSQDSHTALHPKIVIEYIK